jgi:hypothetical protein
MACSPPGDVLIALRIFFFFFVAYLGSDGMCGFLLRESDPLFFSARGSCPNLEE